MEGWGTFIGANFAKAKPPGQEWICYDSVTPGDGQPGGKRLVAFLSLNQGTDEAVPSTPLLFPSGPSIFLKIPARQVALKWLSEDFICYN